MQKNGIGVIDNPAGGDRIVIILLLIIMFVINNKIIIRIYFNQLRSERVNENLGSNGMRHDLGMDRGARNLEYP